MPIKKDESGKHWVEMDVLVPGTPEQVWEAMATGPGNAAWFVRGEIEPRVGGAFMLDFGQGLTTYGEVTEWEPPHRFGYVERDWDEGAPPVATEITIIARSGDRCVVRMVHSLFTTTDDWDDQLESFESGWPGFFAILRIYLAHFSGMPAGSFLVMMPSKESGLAAWQQLVDELDLRGANVGERHALSAGPDHCSGVVEHLYQDAKQRYVILSLDAPSPGIVLVGTNDATGPSGDGGPSVSVCRYFYGDDAKGRAAESEGKWREWLGRTFAVKDEAKTG